MQMPRVICTGLYGLAILSLTCLESIAADGKWAGFLVDKSCADNIKAQGLGIDSLQSHTKECALNENCSKDGYSLFCKGQWYQLDKKGKELAKGLLKSTKTPEGHFVQVTGSLEKGQIKVSNLKELAPH